jgi:hypothetical protein
LPPGAQGKTCQPRAVAASAERSSAARGLAGAARVTAATLTLGVFLEKLIANPGIARPVPNDVKSPVAPGGPRG